jgi:hypothetical protein
MYITETDSFILVCLVCPCGSCIIAIVVLCSCWLRNWPVTVELSM